MAMAMKDTKSCLILLSLLFLGLLFGGVVSKECTNVPTQLSSHTVRYEVLTSKNATWREEMLSHAHVTPTDDSAWYNLLPRKMLKQGDDLSWMMMYRNMKNMESKNEFGKDFLSEVPLGDVRLDPNTIHGRAQQTNLEYLLMLDVDRLAWSFRKTAGLDTPGEPYGGWEAPGVELRGHFVGHYMSASAQMWASTGNETLKVKMTALVSALSVCQERMGTGYLSAFPSELFDRFEAIRAVWAPYYTIHKIMAGLLDQYTLAGNSHAFTMVKWMVDYFFNRVQNVIRKYTIERHWTSLNEETGGMNDVLYRLYSITGDEKHLILAHLFDKPCFLGLLALKADDISGFHANTHIPVVIGSQMRYEITGDPLYKEISTFFMDIVNSSHAYATGGTSVGEFWSDPKRLANTLTTENEESCTTHNMLKVSRHLFKWTKEIAYADYYERALTNGVLSIQRGREPGVMIYMLPLQRGGSKARSYHKWGSQFNDFWCCYGTGIESFSKLGDSIYFEQGGDVPSLYITQYISSSLDWKLGKLSLKQKVEPTVSWDPRLRVTITISGNKNEKYESFTLYLRIPSWAYLDGAKSSLNGQEIPVPAAGNYLSITGSWNPVDTISLELPLTLRTEAIKDDRPEYASLHAILYGPYLIVGLSTGDWDIRLPSSLAASSPQDWITPVPQDYNSHLISVTQQPSGSGNSSNPFVLTNSNKSLSMDEYPEAGTDAAVASTFRVVIVNNNKTRTSSRALWKSPGEMIGQVVMLEPFDLPGMFVVHNGKEEGLGVAIPSGRSDPDVLFRVVKGLDGEDGSVSFESVSEKGCYMYSTDGDSRSVKLSCNNGDGESSSSSSTLFKKATSFKLNQGHTLYHPISFVSKGGIRNFLLMPLFSLRDESYTVYFNIIES